MHIYIDESGLFANPRNLPNDPSCVAVLAVPSSKKKELFQRFRRLTDPWRGRENEIKGKNLDEEQIAQIIALLETFDVILELAIIDMGMHTEADINAFKQLQIAEIAKGHQRAQHPRMVERITFLQNAFEQMPNQLFVQAVLMFTLIPRILFHMILYYARRLPHELQWFYWTVDAKDVRKTAYELAWSDLLPHLMMASTARHPIIFVEGGDYSYFEKFRIHGDQHTKTLEAEKGLKPGALVSTDLQRIISEKLSFVGSEHNLGLQMADVLANATRRGLVGNLNISGWDRIGRLIIRREPVTVKVVHLTPNPTRERQYVDRPSPYWRQLKYIKDTAKELLLDPVSEAALVAKFPATASIEDHGEFEERIDLDQMP